MGVWKSLRIRWTGAMGIQDTVENAMQACIVGEVPGLPVFSFSLKPGKALAEGGLGLQILNWREKLDKLKSDYLPQAAPYSALVVDQTLADKTYTQDLFSTCQDITLKLAARG
jgi:hypothetical protein